MSSKGDSGITCLAWLITIIIGIVMTVVQGWVLTVLWGWFIAPTFHVPELSIAVAIGISFIISMFRSVTPSHKDQTLEEQIGMITGLILLPFVTLLLGWIVHLFM